MRSFLLLVGMFALLACEHIKVSEGEKDLLPSSNGKFGEVLVIVDTLYENNRTGEALAEIFYEALPGLPQQEPQFRMSTVAPAAFKSILKRSRNILKLNIGRGKKTAINIEEDVWAQDQLLLQISAASDKIAARVLKKNLQTIRDYFNEKEIERLKKQFKGKQQKKLAKKLKDRYHINFTLPPAYVQMESTENGFWLKKEKSVGEHLVLQGLSVYFYPYVSDSIFSLAEMIAKRDVFTREHIQGTRENSFMTVYKDYKPDRKEINLNGVYAVEYRGLWNMENDFMGGPFLHYTYVDEERNRVVQIDGFVYAPKFDKREYLRELEALMRMVALNS